MKMSAVTQRLEGESFQSVSGSCNKPKSALYCFGWPTHWWWHLWRPSPKYHGFGARGPFQILTIIWLDTLFHFRTRLRGKRDSKRSTGPGNEARWHIVERCVLGKHQQILHCVACYHFPSLTPIKSAHVFSFAPCVPRFKTFLNQKRVLISPQQWFDSEQENHINIHWLWEQTHHMWHRFSIDPSRNHNIDLQLRPRLHFTTKTHFSSM